MASSVLCAARVHFVVRVDRVEHNGNINDLIISELRRCQFLIADFTLRRYGVYFEAG